MKGRYHSSLYTRSSTANVRRFHRSYNLCTCSSLAGVCRCQRRRSANTPSPAAVALPQSVHLFIRRWCDATQPATQPTPTTVCACGLPLMVRIEGWALAGFSVAEDCGTRAAAWPNELALLFTTRSVTLLHFSHTLFIRPLTFYTFLQHSLVASTATGLSVVSPYILLSCVSISRIHMSRIHMRSIYMKRIHMRRIHMKRIDMKRIHMKRIDMRHIHIQRIHCFFAVKP